MPQTEVSIDNFTDRGWIGGSGSERPQASTLTGRHGGPTTASQSARGRFPAHGTASPASESREHHRVPCGCRRRGRLCPSKGCVRRRTQARVWRCGLAGPRDRLGHRRVAKESSGEGRTVSSRSGFVALIATTAYGLTYSQSDERTAGEIARVAAYGGVVTLCLACVSTRTWKPDAAPLAAGAAAVARLARPQAASRQACSRSTRSIRHSRRVGSNTRWATGTPWPASGS